jgi:hypothetical protein
MDCSEHATLTRHVMRARRDWSEGRAAEDHLVIAEAKEIGKVGVAARELLDLHLVIVCDRQMRAKVIGEALPVEVFAGSNRASVCHVRVILSEVGVRA